MQRYCLPVRNTEFTRADEELLSFVSAERREKVLRQRSPEAKKLSLYAALTARMGISRLTGIPADRLAFSQKKGGKPAADGLADICFSYSHTKGMILCAVTDRGEVGADTELLKTPPVSVAKRAFSPGERQYIFAGGPESLADPETARRFFEIWTKKEAYTKYLGVGLAADLPEIDTLSPRLAPYFHTWREGDHICSVYGEAGGLSPVIRLREEDVADFFGALGHRADQNDGKSVLHNP